MSIKHTNFVLVKLKKSDITNKAVNFLNLLFQLEINKKRDAELAKLRKLLEDVHLESEETAHMLRKKHQEAVVDLQDQLELLAKAKSK